MSESAQFYEFGRLYVRRLTKPDEWALLFGQRAWSARNLITHRPWWSREEPTVLEDYGCLICDAAASDQTPSERHVRWEPASDAFLLQALQSVHPRWPNRMLQLSVSHWLKEGLLPSEADRIRAAVAATGRTDFVIV